MDIKELESFRLADAVKFHDELNPRLWIGDDLDPVVYDKLMAMAEDFMAELGIGKLKVEDITISGSNAAYSYTPHSDIDLHILVDMDKLSNDEVYRELFNAKKNEYNNSHDLKIRGIPVELYVQDSEQPHHSLGEYSLLKKDWIRVPVKRKANFDQDRTRAKYEKLGELIELALKTKSLKDVERVLDIIKRYRKSGLDQTGEFGPENLAFKAIRKQGLFKALWDLKQELHSRELSLANEMGEDYDPKGHEPKKGQKVDPTYNVNETFDKPYKLRWEKGDHGDVDAIAKLPDGNYLSIMFTKGFSQETKEEAWSVEFYRNNSQEVTGEGDAQRVFATVLSAIQTFIKKYKPNKVYFSASKEVEDGQKSQSRARLYDSLVQRYARAWGFKALRADTGDKVIYELNKINKDVAEGKLVESSVFLNPNTVVVGQAHGQPLELSPDTLKKIQAIAAKHGAYYEGNGTDRSYTKGQIDRYVGSWDDEVAKTASPNDPKWLYVLFANVDENNRVQRVGVDPKDTIFNQLLATAKDNSFQGIGYTSQALQKFLQMSSEGKYDFVKMSQQPATQENLTRFLKAGEALMWPSNWEQYPNKAGKIAKAATVDVRDQYLATRKAGVYVTGSGHLKAVQNITGKQGVAEAGSNYYANRTGFSRGARDDERHDLDVQKPSSKKWALKINGKIWSKDGNTVTFDSEAKALKAKQSILAKRPELEVRLLTSGGVAEARRNPEQNPKPESGFKELASIAKTISDPENWAISMTSEPKLGINPQVGISEDTPKGIYFYPLNYALDKTRYGKLPWGDNYPYIQLFQYDRSGEMTKQTKVDPAKLKKALLQYCPEEVIQQASEEGDYDGTPYWFIYDCLSRLGKNDETNVVRWNKVLRDLGFTSVYDDGDGWIAYNEPTQGVVLDPRVIKQHKTITNKQKSRLVTPAVIEQAIFETMDMELASNRAWQKYDPDGSKLRQAAKEYAKKSEFKSYYGKPGSEEIFDKAASWGRYGARQLSQEAYEWFKEQQGQPKVNEASGYIPSEKEKNDPRFKTALTVDVKPDSIKKNAKAFNSKISRAGVPPQLNTNGKF